MSNEEIVKYAKGIVKANLNQYIETGDTRTILGELYNLDNDTNNKHLLGHLKGIDELIQTAIKNKNYRGGLDE